MAMRSMKIALLAASALAASGAAVSQAALAPSAPTEIAAPLAPPVSHAMAEAVVQPSLVKSVGLAALATAALAALYRLLGGEKAGRVLARAGEVGAKAAIAVARVPVSAAKVAARAVGAPLRGVLLFVGLAVFALTGVWLFDIEWAGGLAAGAAGVALVWFGSARAGSALARISRRKSGHSER
jgi:hypothetical protein